MKINLSKPEYRLDRDELARDRDFITGQNYFRLIRRRVPFFMDGYRYAAAAVQERWGIEFAFFEAGHEQVKPCYLPGLLNKKGAEVWWRMMNEDLGFADRLVKEVLAIVDLEKSLAASVPDHHLAPVEIEKFLLAHLEWWTKFFEVGFLWFGIEDIKEKIDVMIKEQWTETTDGLDTFLDEAYRPMCFPLSSVEQRDLLKLHDLKGDEREGALKEHVGKYRHLSLHNIDDEYFDVEYYRGRLMALENKVEYQKTKELLCAADDELVHASEIIAAAKLDDGLKKRINFVRWFMYLRTETIDHMMLVNGAFKPVFTSLAEIFSLPVDAVLHMTYEEMVSGLKPGATIAKDLIMDRTTNGYAFLVTTPPHRSYLVTGKENDELDAFVIHKEDVTTVKELKGQTAFMGKVRGMARVILDRRNAGELKEGEILVTTMTSPEFVPQMKIAGGIITNEGGVLCHAAIMSRELRKPCIIGTKVATDVIKTGQMIILDADNAIIILE